MSIVSADLLIIQFILFLGLSIYENINSIYHSLLPSFNPYALFTKTSNNYFQQNSFQINMKNKLLSNRGYYAQKTG
jgi:hypothetical protein